MAKIHETLRTIKAGARNNKYRVLYPVLGEELDIVCNAASNPGREMGTVEVFIKGRKVQYAAEEQEEGTWELTMYNDPLLQYRNFFLEIINSIHSFGEPQYLNDNGGVQSSGLSVNDINLGTNSTTTSSGGGGDFSGWGKFGDLVNNVQNVVSAANTAYNNVNNAFVQFQRVGRSVQDFTSGDLTGLQEVFNINSYRRPWYMTEIVIEQLDHNGFTVSRTILHNAFVSNVGPIDYSDEAGEVSTSSITFTYSGISFQ